MDLVGETIFSMIFYGNGFLANWTTWDIMKSRQPSKIQIPIVFGRANTSDTLGAKISAPHKSKAQLTTSLVILARAVSARARVGKSFLRPNFRNQLESRLWWWWSAHQVKGRARSWKTSSNMATFLTLWKAHFFAAKFCSPHLWSLTSIQCLTPLWFKNDLA